MYWYDIHFKYTYIKQLFKQSRLLLLLIIRDKKNTLTAKGNFFIQAYTRISVTML